jgi:hypothetical protein
MSLTQPEVAGVVISFAFHAARADASVQREAAQGRCLTPHDRIIVTRWQDRARAAGFDRMVIHDRDEGDASDVGNFLSVHCNGQSWSRWGFARAGRQIRAWCCLTGSDVGQFATLDDALAAVLENVAVKAGALKSRVANVGRATSVKKVSPPKTPAFGPPAFTTNVTNLVAFGAYAKRLGSAA